MKKLVVEGMRVKLKANEEEGWPEEFGILSGIDENGRTAVVTLDKEFWSEEEFDGLREVTLDQIELV